MKTLIIGLGNPILTDDGVGVRVAYGIQEALKDSNRDITVCEASVGGLRLMEMMVDYDRAILVDAILGQNGLKPGEYRRMSLDDLEHISPTQHSSSSHDTTLITALDLGQRIGLKLPEDIIIYAIGVEKVYDFGESPTPAVAAAIPEIVQTVLHEALNP